MLTNSNESLEKRFTDSGLGRLWTSLNFLNEWLSTEMRRHLDPPDDDTYLLKSDDDVSDMIEAYLGALFHSIFQLSDPPVPPHNTSNLNRPRSLEQMNMLRKRYKIAAKFENSFVKLHIDYLKKQILSWLSGGASNEDVFNNSKIWAGCHLWLEKRIVTGNRLLFLEGRQWSENAAHWTINRIAYDWQSTFAKSIIRRFKKRSGVNLTDATQPLSELCTCICAFRNQAEKNDFERISGFKKGEYIYLWCGEEEHENSDFREDYLVWFKDAGMIDKQCHLSDAPVHVVGPEETHNELWGIIRDNIAKSDGDLTNYRDIGRYTGVRHSYRKRLEEGLNILNGIKENNLLPEDHWYQRCTTDFNSFHNGSGTPSDNYFWDIQSVMFYDWKYWYIFPTNYGNTPNGGLGISSAIPLTAEQIKFLALIAEKILYGLSEVEEWSRARISERREQNLRASADRVHRYWVENADQMVNITNHRELFRTILQKLFDLNGTHYLPAYRIKSENERHLLQRTWNEHQKENINYAVVNYWNEISRKEEDRIFAEWLSPKLSGDDPQADWDGRWNSYSAITAEARKFDPPHYTLNDFLFDKAPEKAIIEWRGNDQQIFPRGHETPLDWVRTPPSITPEVASIIFIGPPDETNYHLVKGKALREKIANQIKTLQGHVFRLKPHIEKCREDYYREMRIVRYSKKSSDPEENNGYLDSIEFTLDGIRQEIENLEFIVQNDTDDGRQSISAEYLVRLSIYLNFQMGIKDDEDFLGLSRCIFLTWALYSHFGPKAMNSTNEVDSLSPHRAAWNFYSIPVHVPLSQRGEAQRTSILSLGTKGPLTQQDLNLWREAGRETVFPAMMIDQKTEIHSNYYQKLRAGMAVGLYHQLGQVLASSTARVNILIEQGKRLHELAVKLNTTDKVGKAAIEKWDGQVEIGKKRLVRAQMFRNFAYAQLTGTFPGERRDGTVQAVTEEAFEVAKEYLYGGEESEEIKPEYGEGMENVFINEDAYGFILQEIIANAYRHLSGHLEDDSLPKSIYIRVTAGKKHKSLEVRNAITYDEYCKFLEKPLNISEEPGPESHSGRGLYGVNCLFRARGVENAPDSEYLNQDSKYWLVLKVPIINFHTSSDEWQNDDSASPVD